MTNGREVSSREVSLAEAKAIKGLRAVFGEVGVESRCRGAGDLLLLLWFLSAAGGRTELRLAAAALLWEGGFEIGRSRWFDVLACGVRRDS